MHLEYIVSERLGRWIVRRGTTVPLEFSTRVAALKAAETLAKGSADNGDISVVKLVRDGAVQSAATCVPRLPRGAARVRFEPERDGGPVRGP